MSEEPGVEQSIVGYGPQTNKNQNIIKITYKEPDFKKCLIFVIDI